MLLSKKYYLYFGLIMIVNLLITPSVWADEDETPEQELTGFFLGVNAGFGGSCVQWSDSGRSITDEAEDGYMGSFRAGYAFSPKFALSFEAHGMGWSDESKNDDEAGIGAALLALTWHPTGKGFFVRGGVGSGGGDYLHPDTGAKITIEERAAALFSIGYDWQVGSKTTLGLSFDAFSIDAGGTTGFEDDYIGAGGMTLQFNWFL